MKLMDGGLLVGTAVMLIGWLWYEVTEEEPVAPEPVCWQTEVHKGVETNVPYLCKDVMQGELPNLYPHLKPKA